MEDLKQYKDVWKQQEHKSYQIDGDTITKMIHKKSSSIVKWIFYISLLEFTVLTLINIFVKLEDNETEIENIGLSHFMDLVNLIVGYLIPLIFIYLFYKNYKRISVTSNTKELIHSILKTRKTVKYYIFTVLIAITFTLLYSTFVILHTDEYASIFSNYGTNGQLIIWIVIVLFILVVDALILLFYMLLYGFLIRRLTANYKELIRH